MNYATVPYSHIQLLVPMQYVSGGVPSDPTKYALWDGKLLTYTTTSGSDATHFNWAFPTTVLAKWLLILRHYGVMTSGVYISNVSDVVTATEENIGQTAHEWTFNEGNGISRVSGKGALCSALLEVTIGASTTLEFGLYEVVPQSYCAIQGLVWSRDFRVPMYNSDWEASHEFPALNSTRNPGGVVCCNFELAKQAERITRHRFNWTELTADEYDVWWKFREAFGGSLAQPFWMCEIQGDGAFLMMRVRELIIEPQTFTHGRKKKSGMYYIGFSAIEVPTI